jgi:hypothetical protein
VNNLKDEMGILRNDVNNLKDEMGILRIDVNLFSEQVHWIREGQQELQQITRALRDGQEELKAQLDSLAEQLDSTQKGFQEHLRIIQEEHKRQRLTLDTLALRSIEQEAQIRQLQRA